MKKLESLKLNKFKPYEISKESHNHVLGGWRGDTHRASGTTCDEYNDGSKFSNGGRDLWPSADVSTVSGVQ